VVRGGRRHAGAAAAAVPRATRRKLTSRC
jgi:hypothetical protein